MLRERPLFSVIERQKVTDVVRVNGRLSGSVSTTPSRLQARRNVKSISVAVVLNNSDGTL